MAQVQLLVGGRRYRAVCQDGGEAHLEELAREIDRKVAEVTRSMGPLDEPRALLFAALLLADEMAEARSALEAAAAAPPPAPAIDPMALRALERLADRVEALADGLEEAEARA